MVDRERQTPNAEALSAFWPWFVETETRIIDAFCADRYEWLEDEIGGRLQRICTPDLKPRLNWEIGPGRSREWQFVVSPVVRRNLDLTKAIVAAAPALPRWEWYSSKPPKPGRPLCLDLFVGGRLAASIDARQWSYALRRTPEGNLRILLVGRALVALAAGERARVGDLLLENLVGEEALLTLFEEVRVVDESVVSVSVALSRLEDIPEHLALLEAESRNPAR